MQAQSQSGIFKYERAQVFKSRLSQVADCIIRTIYRQAHQKSQPGSSSAERRIRAGLATVQKWQENDELVTVVSMYHQAQGSTRDFKWIILRFLRDYFADEEEQDIVVEFPTLPVFLRTFLISLFEKTAAIQKGRWFSLNPTDRDTALMTSIREALMKSLSSTLDQGAQTPMPQQWSGAHHRDEDGQTSPRLPVPTPSEADTSISRREPKDVALPPPTPAKPRSTFSQRVRDKSAKAQSFAPSTPSIVMPPSVAATPIVRAPSSTSRRRTTSMSSTSKSVKTLSITTPQVETSRSKTVHISSKPPSVMPTPQYHNDDGDDESNGGVPDTAVEASESPRFFDESEDAPAVSKSD